MTDPDTAARSTIDVGQLAAAELLQRLQLLANLSEHPRTNARVIDAHAAEARALLEQIGAQLLNVGGVHA